jgi:hypothetical protein
MLNQKAVQLFKVLWKVSKKLEKFTDGIVCLSATAFISLISKKINFNETPASYDLLF